MSKTVSPVVAVLVVGLVLIIVAVWYYFSAGPVSRRSEQRVDKRTERSILGTKKALTPKGLPGGVKAGGNGAIPSPSVPK